MCLQFCGRYYFKSLYIDNNFYKVFIDKSSDEFLNLCKVIAGRNSTNTICKVPVKLIKKLFKEDNKVSGLKVS